MAVAPSSMPAAPKAASNWRSERQDARAITPRRRRRLTQPAQFAAVANARGPQGLRGSRHWLALSCKLGQQELPAVVADSSASPALRLAALRLGLTVPKRLARRAVDRNLIKRVVREAMHAVVASIEADMAKTLDALDVVIRLKTALPPVERLPRAQLRRQLHLEAHELFDALKQEVMKRKQRVPGHQAPAGASS